MKKKHGLLLIFTILMIALLSAVPVSAKPKYSKVYGNLLKKYKYEFNTGYKYNGKTQKNSILLNSQEYSRKYRKIVTVPRPDKSVRFQLLDLDGNGVKELIVRRQYGTKDSFSYEYYFFTIKSGKLKYVPYANSSSRNISTSSVLKWNKKKKALIEKRTSSRSDSSGTTSYISTEIYQYKKGKISRFRVLSKDSSSDGFEYYNISDGDNNSIIYGSKSSSYTGEKYAAAKQQYDSIVNTYVKPATKKIGGYVNNPSNRKKRLK